LSKLEQEVARLSREVESSSPSREASITPSPDDSSEIRHDTRGKIISAPEAQYFSPFSWAAVPEDVRVIIVLLHYRFSILTSISSLIFVPCLEEIEVLLFPAPL
jgi:hypothetical protein